MTEVSEGRLAEIEDFVDTWLHDEDVPGASVVVVDADEELYAEGFGARDIASNAPATPDTLYGQGSITKSLTAVAVVELAERGELSLEEPVTAYVEHFRDAPGEPITIAELLSHTSGMPATSPGVLAQAFTGVPAGIADEDDRIRFVTNATSYRVTDEERFLYYNTGYDILGRVIEAVDGREYAEYIRQELFEELGMQRSFFHRDAVSEVSDVMTGYTDGEAAPEPVEFPFEDLIHPSGGLIASVRDMSRFIRAAMTDGTLEEGRLASPSVLDRTQRGRTVRQRYIDGREQEYGFGWMRTPLVGDTIVSHGGSIDISTAFAGFLEDAQIGVCVACNTTSDPHPMEVGPAILAIATGHEPTAEPTFALQEKCDRVSGEYESFNGDVTALVEPDGGGLEVGISTPFGAVEHTALPETLDPTEYLFYSVTADGARSEFEFDLSGDTDDLFYGRARLQRA